MKKGTKLGVFGCFTAYDNFYNKFKNDSRIDYIGRGSGLDMQNSIKYFLGKNGVNVNPYGIGFYLSSPKRLNVVVHVNGNGKVLRKVMI